MTPLPVSKVTTEQEQTDAKFKALLETKNSEECAEALKDIQAGQLLYLLRADVKRNEEFLELRKHINSLIDQGLAAEQSDHVKELIAAINRISVK